MIEIPDATQIDPGSTFYIWSLGILLAVVMTILLVIALCFIFIGSRDHSKWVKYDLAVADREDRKEVSRLKQEWECSRKPSWVKAAVATAAMIVTGGAGVNHLSDLNQLQAELQAELDEGSEAVEQEVNDTYPGVQVLTGSDGTYSEAGPDLAERMMRPVSRELGDPDTSEALYGREDLVFRDADGELIEDAYLVKDPSDEDGVYHETWIEIPSDHEPAEYEVYNP